MKKLILSVLAISLSSVSVMGAPKLQTLKNKHIDCLTNSAKKTYKKVVCGEKIDFDKTNETIKNACDALVLNDLPAVAKSQNELNLQRNFREYLALTESKFYSILSSEVQVVRARCDAKTQYEKALSSELKKEVRKGNYDIHFSQGAE